MDELVSDFLAETNESLVSLDNELVTLEQNPNDEDLLGSIFRIMHTIKGTCGFLGLGRLEKLAHAAENVLGKIREGEAVASADNISIVLKSIDQIKDIIAYLEQNEVEPEGGDDELITKLNAAAEGIKAPASEDSTTEELSENISESQEPEIEEIKAEESKTEVKKADEVKKKEAVDSGLKVAKKLSAKEEKEKAAAAAAKQTVRVNVSVLEQLMQTVSELVLNRNQLLQILRSNKESEFSAPVQRLSNITSELQEQIMQTRMQPISHAWAKFPRLVRDLSMELNKKINLEMIGEDTELDRQLIEAIKDPLTHMVRNSCDHGLETPEERVENGKPELGTVQLKAYHQGGHIIIEIVDDGKGINIERVKEKILENELATASELAALTNEQIMQYIFRAGFSTAAQVTAVSGRGVGMDVVRSNIEKISGNVELKSVEGKGSTFFIKIPLTLAIMPILIIASNDQKFGMPQINVLEIVRAGKGTEYAVEVINSCKVLRLRENLLPLISLSKIIGYEEQVDLDNYHVVVSEVGGKSFGLIVDKIYDTEEIVVKPVSPILKSISIYSGSTLLGDGSVIMILDPNGVTKMIGDLNTGNQNAGKGSGSVSNDENTSFLVIDVDDDSPKAVPLELVSRLEEIKAENVEYSDGKAVVQYREALMHLTLLDSKKPIPRKGNLQVVVFANAGQIMGLVVKEIIDIVEQKAEIMSSSVESEKYNGVMIIKGKSTDLLDVSNLFSKIISQNDAFKISDVNSKIDSSKKTLFVDDSAFFRKLVPSVIKEIGSNVVIAKDGLEALDILEHDHEFDLILTDINMPGMDGYGLSEACRNDEKYSKIPIVALSSYLDSEVISKKNQEAFKYVISKTNNEMLKQHIKEVLFGSVVNDK